MITAAERYCITEMSNLSKGGMFCKKKMPTNKRKGMGGWSECIFVIRRLQANGRRYALHLSVVYMRIFLLILISKALCSAPGQNQELDLFLVKSIFEMGWMEDGKKRARKHCQRVPKG